jgi:hypothetical protein
MGVRRKKVIPLPRAPTKTLAVLLFFSAAFTLSAYTALSAGSPGWAGNLKTFALCLIVGTLAALSANQITKEKKGGKKACSGAKKKKTEQSTGKKG